MSLLVLLGKIIVASLLFLGIPAAILWLRDRSRLIGGLINRVLGTCALVLVIGMVVWVIYAWLFLRKEVTWTSERVLHIIVAGSAAYGFYKMVALIGWIWFTDSGPEPDLKNVDHESPEMQEAAIKVKKSLPRFINEIKNGSDDAQILCSYEWDEEDESDVWIPVLDYQFGIFTTSFFDPDIMPEDEDLDIMKVPESEVKDWMIMHPDGKISGAFTQIGAIEYYQSRGRRLDRTMKRKKALLLDA